MTNPAQVVVVGGGISGLACALRLQQLGAPVTLLEANDRPGGLIETVENQWVSLRIGAAKFPRHRNSAEPDSRLGHRKRAVQSRSASASIRAARRAAAENPDGAARIFHQFPARPGLAMANCFRGFGRTTPAAEEESVAQFVRRKFGHEILESSFRRCFRYSTRAIRRS